MEIDRNRVVVSPVACDGRTPRALHVRHRDFPEVNAEGRSPADAGANLANLLARALDSAPSDYRRSVAAQALADVRAFVTQSN